MDLKFSINLAFFIFLMFLVSCQDSEKNAGESPDVSNEVLFSLVPSSHSGIDFKNIVELNTKRHYTDFNPIYDGGGVALGDINNDGLLDIYFTANEFDNKLYLNKGNLQFEDITEKAGISGGDGWHNGANMMDFNGDGHLDIYVCRGGWIKDPKLRTNLLFINNGDLTFSEKASDYGLADQGYSFHTSFFDYDNDGDLDMYLINHPADGSGISMIDYARGRKSDSPFEKDKLFENKGNNTFENVSEKAKITNNFGFGLSVTNADLDDDGFMDIYVTNDYTERDYCWMNNGDGTFTDKALEMMKHVPLFSMGTDIADFNNDGLEDIYNTEMLPWDYKKSKTNMADMNVTEFNMMVANDFHHQYMHNMLQMNRGQGHFSEIAQLAGIAKTDWSWACYLADFNNSGERDIFVANGYRKDALNKDDARKVNDYLVKNNVSREKVTMGQLKEIDAMIAEQKISNRFFEKTGELTFSDVTNKWSDGSPSFSNGAAIGDMDNDGDLDIVVNNIEDEAFLYKNNASENGNNFLQIELKGTPGNPDGIGAKVRIRTKSGKQVFTQKTTRGYLSCVDPVIHFGIGKDDLVEKIEVNWIDSTVSILQNVKANSRVKISYDEAGTGIAESQNNLKPLLRDVTDKHFDKPHFHKENPHNDYRLQVLLPHKISALGPFVSVGDINGDLDLYVVSGGTEKYQDSKI